MSIITVWLFPPFFFFKDDSLDKNNDWYIFEEKVSLPLFLIDHWLNAGLVERNIRRREMFMIGYVGKNFLLKYKNEYNICNYYFYTYIKDERKM